MGNPELPQWISLILASWIWDEVGRSMGGIVMRVRWRMILGNLIPIVHWQGSGDVNSGLPQWISQLWFHASEMK